MGDCDIKVRIKQKNMTLGITRKKIAFNTKEHKKSCIYVIAAEKILKIITITKNQPTKKNAVSSVVAILLFKIREFIIYIFNSY